MTRHALTPVEEVPTDGSRVIVELEGREIAVFRYDGAYYAVLNYCMHQSGPLCEGALEGCSQSGEDGWEWTYDDDPKHIVCPWHGWTFDITTGDCISDSRYTVPTYDVEVEDGTIYLRS
jgi:nitrite reductase/ring-hydroxylating ferredoxin subunit